jgi:sigma-B regulation protein RsbU (phosphoserine phosphatase)
MQSFTGILLSLANCVAVIVVIAYFLTRSQLYQRVLEKREAWADRALLILIFGLFSIYGTVGGIKVEGGIASIRDLGPSIAGLLAGPVVGMSSGIIGGIHRYFQGGFTALPCSFAPVAAGLAGGIIHYLRRGAMPKIGWAVVFMACVELFHMGITIAISRPIDKTWALVELIIVPMVLMNAAGMGIYAYIMKNLKKERSLEKAKLTMECELAVAREIQMSLVPKTFPPIPARKEFSLFAALEPAREVGGDMYDFYYVGDNTFFFMIGDVSGKGVPAALYMAVTRTVIRSKIFPADAGLELIMHKVNKALCEGNETSMFVTVFCGFLDVPTGNITYVNAGHNSPVIVRTTGEAYFLDTLSNPSLGVIDDIQYKSGELHLEAGDTIVLYTDGVTEATDKRQSFFAEDRLLAVLENSSGITVRDIAGKVLSAVHDFAGKTDPADDITLLALRMET